MIKDTRFTKKTLDCKSKHTHTDSENAQKCVAMQWKEMPTIDMIVQQLIENQRQKENRR